MCASLRSRRSPSLGRDPGSRPCAGWRSLPGRRRWASALALALVALFLGESDALARERRRRGGRGSKGAVIPKGSATHALKPLEAIGMDRKRVDAVTAALAEQIAAVPGVKLAPLAGVRRFLKSRDGAAFAVCEGDVQCVYKLGTLIGAPLVVAGDLSGLAKGYVLFLRLADPAKQEVVRKVSVVYGGEPGKEASVLKEAAYRLLAPEKFVGKVAFDIDVKGAKVFLNGQPLGESPVAVREVQAGTHALRVTHPAYHDYLRFIEVGFEQTTTVKVSLKMYPIIAEEVKAKGGPGAEPVKVAPGQQVIYRPLPWYKKWWFITSVGAAVLAATVTTVALARQRHLDRDASITLEKPLRSPAPVLLRFGR